MRARVLSLLALSLTVAVSAAVAGIVISVTPTIPKGWKTYTDAKIGYAIAYPPGWVVDRHYIYTGFGPDHDIRGVAFTIPPGVTKGTNLSSNMTGVSIESVDGGRSCDAKRFLPYPADLRTLKNAGFVWSTANMQDAGAGNFYDLSVFALPGTKPCLAVRYTIHSTNIGNYDPGTVREFDRAALIRTFAAIRHTLHLKNDR